MKSLQPWFGDQIRQLVFESVLLRNNSEAVTVPAQASPFMGKGGEYCVGESSSPGATMDRQRIGFQMLIENGKVIHVWVKAGYDAMKHPGAAAIKMGPDDQIYPNIKAQGVQVMQTPSRVLENGEVVFTTAGGITWHLKPGSYDIVADGVAGANFKPWTGKLACAADLAGAIKALGEVGLD